MGPVHVGIRHDDDLAVTQLRQIKFISNAASQSGDNRHQLVIAVDLIQPGLFHVEHFAPQRKDRLEFPVPPALGGAAGGISLYDIDFRFLRISGLAVRQLARQGGAFQRGFSSYQLPGLPGGLSGPAGGHSFFKDGPGGSRVLLQISGKLFTDQIIHQGADLRIAQLRLGLALKLGFLQLDADDGGQALPHILAGQILIPVL